MEFLDQIVDWLRSCAWPFVRSHAMLIVGIWAAVAATFSAWWARKALRPKARPRIVDPKITVATKKIMAYEAAAGSFVVANDGSKPCNLQEVRISAADLTFEVVAVTDEMVLSVDKLNKTAGKLPLLIRAYEHKTVFFNARHKIEELPQTLNLEAKLDCRTIRQEVNRVGKTYEYT